ncbi:MAG: TetR/AcrR family transcriptional regulator [Rhodanobacter sp.]
MNTPSAIHTPSARQRSLDTADRLFYQEGLRATGIDRIIAESGVAKMSFYRHFPSKDDLITAFLARRHEAWMAWFESTVEARINKAGAGWEVIADVLGQWFKERDFRGCAFINTMTESGSTDSDAQRFALKHKTDLATYLETLAKRLGLLRSRQVVEATMIVIEGTIVRAQMTRDASVVTSCRSLLKAIGQSAARSVKKASR